MLACAVVVQIYEVTTPDEAHALSAMGVDHVGVLVGDGSFPREQTVDAAREIFAAIGPGSKGCALSLSHDLNLIASIIGQLSPDIMHLGAAPEYLLPPQVRTLKAAFPGISLMRSIPVLDEDSIAIARSYDGIADFLLLDSYKRGDRQIGATGVAHNWELDRRIIENVRTPVIIAGGLGPENVGGAIQASRPAGIDSKTKTDTSDGSHTKDLQKVRAFLAAAREADLEFLNRSSTKVRESY